MLSDIDYFEILDSIITNATIFVMNMFAWRELSAEMQFHDVSMLEYSFTVHNDPLIVSGIIDTLRCSIATHRTKVFRFLSRRGYGKSLCAIFASLFTPRVIVSLFACDRLQSRDFSIRKRCGCRASSRTESGCLLAIKPVLKNCAAHFAGLGLPGSCFRAWFAATNFLGAGLRTIPRLASAWLEQLSTFTARYGLQASVSQIPS
jgi:hypothetical protein